MSFRKLTIVVSWCVLLTALTVPFVGRALSEDASSNPTDTSKVNPSLGSRQPSPQRVVDTKSVIESLQDSDPVIRRRAASDVAKLRGDAKKAVPALIIMLQDDDVSLQEAAARALGTIGPNAKDALPQLIEALGRDPEVRSA